MAANVMASKDREVNLILINSVCVCKYHSSCYLNTSDNSWNDVNIPYWHAQLLDSDDLLYSNNFSISYAHLQINTMPQSSCRLRERRNGLCGCFKVCCFFFCTYGHACTGMREQRNGLCGCFWQAVLKYLFFSFFPPRTATHIRARESKGTACVVVVSGARFESFFLFVCLHVRPRTYGHAPTGMHQC